METEVIPPPGLQDVVTHSVGPPAIVDSPMQEVPSQAENQVNPCILRVAEQSAHVTL